MNHTELSHLEHVHPRPSTCHYHLSSYYWEGAKPLLFYKFLEMTLLKQNSEALYLAKQYTEDFAMGKLDGDQQVFTQ